MNARHSAATRAPTSASPTCGSRLRAGQRGTAAFDLTLHLANGSYHVAAYLYRYDKQQQYDRVVPAVTFHVATHMDLVGPLHTYPRLTRFEVDGHEVATPAADPSAALVR